MLCPRSSAPSSGKDSGLLRLFLEEKFLPSGLYNLNSLFLTYLTMGSEEEREACIALLVNMPLVQILLPQLLISYQYDITHSGARNDE